MSPKVVHNQDNYKILEEYWKREYEDRDLVDRATAYYSLRRAVEAVGNLPLISATKKELQQKVNTEFKGNGQRRIIERLNKILAFIGRSDVRLLKARPERYKVHYLTEGEFKKVLSYIEDPLDKLLHEVCFYTGMRIGEAFACSDLIDNKLIKIVSQIDKEGVERSTKTRKPRKAFVFKAGRAALKRWIKERSNYKTDRNRISKITHDACRKAFPGNEEKDCTFHDLRHSYAIMLLGKGNSISIIAQCLGNSVTVCEQHYTGSILADESINLIQRLVED